jgi:putative acetyltransferase
VFSISRCPANAPALLALVDAMTAELVPLYGLPPDAKPAPLDSSAHGLLALQAGESVGCCAIQSAGPGRWELKRMYVDPTARGTAAAGLLMAAAEQLAGELGGTAIRLETGVRQPAAIRLYERSGYRRIPNYPPYQDDPISVCFEKTLG